MRFREFWPLYLQAHQLPGTRSLHYVATLLGATSVADAVLAGEPMVGVAGIAGGYLIAVAAHWLVGRNQPLIGVDPLRGAVADLRMCWLAATGRLKDELERFGIASGRAPASLAAAATQPTQSGWIAACNLAVVLASLAGLLAALGDFDDLFEAAVALDFPFLQLGMPVVVFAMALFAACSSIPARRPSTAAERRCGGCASTQQDSMRRASAILFGLGFGGFGAAELAEHGASFPISLFLAGMALTTLGIGGSLVHPGRR